jgi:hypothetical protein
VKFFFVNGATGTILRPLLAKDMLATAAGKVTAWAPDARPVALAVMDSLNLDGRADFWISIYYSPAKDSSLTFMSYDGIDVGTSASSGIRMSDRPLPEGWMDSDAAMNRAWELGGGDFWNRNLHCRARGILMPTFSPDTTVWQIIFYGSAGDTLTLTFHAVTGALISSELVSAVGRAEAPLPGECILEANYPNPFNPETEIAYTLSKRENARLSVLDVRGREIAVLADGRAGSGRHVVRWDGTASDGTKPGSGVYLVRIVTPSATRVRKMTLIR